MDYTLRGCTLAICLAVTLQPSAGTAQVSTAVHIGSPQAIVSEPFTLIKGVRELGDGRVLVTDWIETRLVVVDFVADKQTDLGRVGSGPNEFRLPGRLVAMPGDSTMLVDDGNARLMVIGPNLSFVRSISNREHGERFQMSPRGVDARGALYFGVSPFAVADGPVRADSVPIAHWSPRYRAVEMMPDLLLKASTGKPSGPSLGLPYVAFAKQDDWAVAADGWVGVVRSEPYRVEWYGPSGEKTIGPEIAYERRPVSMDDRRDHVRTFLAGSMQSGRGEGGGMGLLPADAQSPREIDRIARTSLFAEEFPPFEPGGVWMSGDVMWVQRSLPVSNASMFDVFDRTGARRHTFSLPMGRRLVGIGAQYFYAVRADEFDLLSLERYVIPQGGR